MNLFSNSRAVIGTAIVLFSAASMSADVATSTTNTKQQESTSSQTEQAHSQWGITSTEYSRYQELMKGIRGSISPSTISPIEVLGIHARNASERDKYARLWADAMEKDAERVLAFSNAYDNAWKGKGSPTLIDLSKFTLSDAGDSFKSNTGSLNGVDNNLLFITKISGCEPCDSRLESLLTTLTVDTLSTLDIYFIDTQGNATGVVRKWAQSKNIDTTLLKNKRITLNHGVEIAKNLKLSGNDLPAVFKKSDQGGVKRVK